MGNVRSKKVEGGQGGKRGHSNMTHWEFTETIQDECRVPPSPSGTYRG